MKSNKVNSVWLLVASGERSDIEWIEYTAYTRADARAVAKERAANYKYPVKFSVRKFVDEKTTA